MRISSPTPIQRSSVQTLLLLCSDCSCSRASGVGNKRPTMPWPLVRGSIVRTAPKLWSERRCRREAADQRDAVWGLLYFPFNSSQLKKHLRSTSFNHRSQWKAPSQRVRPQGRQGHQQARINMVRRRRTRCRATFAAAAEADPNLLPQHVLT